MNIFGNKGEGKMKKTEGYIVKELDGNEYGIEASEVYEDVKNVVKTFREKGILL